MCQAIILNLQSCKCDKKMVNYIWKTGSHFTNQITYFPSYLDFHLWLTTSGILKNSAWSCHTFEQLLQQSLSSKLQLQYMELKMHFEGSLTPILECMLHLYMQIIKVSFLKLYEWLWHQLFRIAIWWKFLQVSPSISKCIVILLWEDHSLYRCLCDVQIKIHSISLMCNSFFKVNISK